MSCNCSCGSDCKCGSGCKCGMYPDLSYSETTSTETIIAGVAPVKMFSEGSEMSYGAENDYKCGSSCSCSSCGCHK
ncbi:metallothionein-like protein type 2 [Malus sylvestris]|uniref:metallothionein-like protein type 2 n=1 Tax=Malus sylvestris TaxID=3752 RepID=UPI0021AC884D|nr:metallothionein-like protein type 2 [Malus sylvestris]